MKGKDGVRQGYAGFLKVTPDFKIAMKFQITTDKMFALEATFTGTQKGDFLVCLQQIGASLRRHRAMEYLKTAR